jgi:hypothetical protein
MGRPTTAAGMMALALETEAHARLLAIVDHDKIAARAMMNIAEGYFEDAIELEQKEVNNG